MRLSYRTASKPGLLLGGVLLALGAAAILHPPTLLVHHPTARPSVFPSISRVEPITTGRARLYGGGGVLFGAGLMVFSLAAPRCARATTPKA